MDIHFWTLRPIDDALLWEPDLEPDRFQNGFGHAFLELYARLREFSEEHSVTLGATIPKATAVVVVNMADLTGWKRGGQPKALLKLCRALLGRQCGLFVIRNDIPASWDVPFCTTREAVPNRASAKTSMQVHIPLMPQRGLIRRSGSRPPTVETVALKAFRNNLPTWIDTLDEGLRQLGVSLRVDTEISGDGSSWSDFSTVDIALCIPPRQLLDNEERKPATKLINAYAAGVIPFATRLPAYVEVGKDGIDCVFILNDPASIIQEVRSLLDDQRRAAALLSASTERGKEFSVDALLTSWLRAMLETPPIRQGLVLLDLLAGTIQLALQGLFGRRVAARWREELGHGRRRMKRNRRQPA